MSETDTATRERSGPNYEQQPILEAEGMVKLFGRVVASAVSTCGSSPARCWP